jgi:hypothetical protein
VSAAVRITALTLEGITPNLAGRAFTVTMTMHMTPEQRRAAVLELLGDIPEQDVFEFMRAEFPAWFTEVPA